jgi:hypothetical protein
MGLKDLFGGTLRVTSVEDQDPFFRPRRYGHPRDLVLRTALEVLATLPGWRLEEHRERQGLIRASSGSLFPPSAEDIDLYIVTGTDGVTGLEMTSRSRGGKWGWGRNERNLRDFLSRMDRKLPPSA